jgi:hypothetical protein
MSLKKITFKPGVNRERTRYTNEGGWFDCDKIRFRQGSPEKIGGWTRISDNTFDGKARSLRAWTTLGNIPLVGIGTHKKFYVEEGGRYYDITPVRKTTTASVSTINLARTDGSTTITVTDTGHGAEIGDFVTFAGFTTLGGGITAAVLNKEHEITGVTSANVYTFTATATSTGAANLDYTSSSQTAEYQENIGKEGQAALTGWGGGAWNETGTTWGNGGSTTFGIRLWHQQNFGEDLVLGFDGGKLYTWDATNGTSTRGVLVSGLAGASGVPTSHNNLVVSDVSRFVFCLGANPFGAADLDPLLIRWSDQESLVDWTPSATNQAGSLRLSQGSKIVTGANSRQAVLVWTDAALYSLQYVGAPIVWGANLVGENISIASKNAVAYANGIAYWMGTDKFYKYDGRTETLKCDLRRYVFNDFNADQYEQVFAGTNESFNEIWWFYCATGSDVPNRYVIYNYSEDVWYFGNLRRTAWVDSGARDHPLAATTSGKLVEHEQGLDDNETTTPAAITAFITSADFDLDDGHRLFLVNRIMPDVTFDGSTAVSPSVTLTLDPLTNSGSGIKSTPSEGGNSSGTVTRFATSPVETFTDQLDVRIRGRQLNLKIQSNTVGVQWQLGSPRLDMRPDGRR